jgi:HSP20 family molecular chaperone IbpA
MDPTLEKGGMAVEATYRNGVLEVVLPEKENPERKRIEIH